MSDPTCPFCGAPLKETDDPADQIRVFRCLQEDPDCCSVKTIVVVMRGGGNE